MGYSDDWNMDPAEVEQVMREVRRRYLKQRRRELAETLLIAVAGLGGAVAMVYFWRMS